MILLLHVQVHFITTEDDCERLRDLISKPVIGLDAEWRPNMTKFIKTRPSLLQISDASNVYIVDLLSLSSSPKLNDILGQVFQDETSLKVGLALRADLTRVQNFDPDSSFAERMIRHVDLGLLH